VKLEILLDPGPANAEEIARTTVAGKYSLVRTIGCGAMGVVFEAIHTRLHQRFAIKFLRPELFGKREAVARFEREGRAASGLTSPYAARIFDVDKTAEGFPYMVSELLEGRDLRQEIDARGRLPVEEVVTWIIQAAAVMAEAHALGVVHRDLKPSNLFLARVGSGRTVKVLDFGISKMEDLEDSGELTNTGVILGTPRYMSPEQVQGRKVDGRSDIWSLGVILFHAISGTYPFMGTTTMSLAMAVISEPPRDLRDFTNGAVVPAGLAEAINKALSRDVLQRYATMRDFAEALAPYASPDAATLAKTLSSDVAPSSSANVGAILDIPIAVEPTEQRTRGTWETQATTLQQEISTSQARPVRVRRSLVAGIAVAAVVVGSAAIFLPRALHSSSSPEPSAAPAAAPPPPVTETSPTPFAVASEQPAASAPAKTTLPVRASKPSTKASPPPTKPATPSTSPKPSPDPTRNPSYL